jgi:hypothetical protein
VDEPVGGTGAVDQHLEERREKRRQALRDGERDQSEPPASAQEEQSDERERQGTAEPAPEPVEDEREMGEQRCLEVTHRLGPAALELERLRRYEDGDQRDEREHSAGCPKRPSRMREKRFARLRHRLQIQSSVSGCAGTACGYLTTMAGASARRLPPR